MVAAYAGKNIPLEIKYRHQHTNLSDVKGLLAFCLTNECSRGYIVTRSINDFGLLTCGTDDALQLLKIPAPLLCFWTGQVEVVSEQPFADEEEFLGP